MYMQTHHIIQKIEGAIKRGEMEPDVAEAVFEVLEIEWRKEQNIQVRLQFEVNLTRTFGQPDDEVVKAAMAEIEIPSHYEASDVYDYEIMEVPN